MLGCVYSTKVHCVKNKFMQIVVKDMVATVGSTEAKKQLKLLKGLRLHTCLPMQAKDSLMSNFIGSAEGGGEDALLSVDVQFPFDNPAGSQTGAKKYERPTQSRNSAQPTTEPQLHNTFETDGSQ